ncbi:MAG: hypothetical protein ACYDA5_09875 [Vulcanimicrobiaceae bacterium]
MNRRFVCLAASLAIIAALVLGTSSARTRLMALYTFNHTLRDSSGNGKAIVTAPLNISVAALPQVTFGAWVKAVSLTTPRPKGRGFFSRIHVAAEMVA